MNQRTKSIIAYLVATMMSVIFSANICKAGQAAPYTKDAYVKIEQAHKDCKLPSSNGSATPLEKQKASIKSFREIFAFAGYDFDATIRKIAYDLKNNPESIPRDSENVATMVLVLMSYMKSQCEYEHLDCLDLFDSQTSESIKWLWGNTGFKP
ncbi:MAG: hypothetical protein FP814_14085 [Desulfobacterium sp.]|nr:hypothetical protein [Desulfobacterium sp.]MBU3946805.1 hypothetical protein [Pseudomonadota bacterium]